MKKILTLFAVVGLIIFTSCEGPDGPPGLDAPLPQAFTVNNVNLVRVTNNQYEFTRTFNQYVGGDLYNDETVLIYRKTGTTNAGAPVWQLLPNVINYDNGDIADYFFDYSKEDFLITVTASFNLATEPSLINSQTFRVVISPSDLIAGVNKNNYLDVAKTLKLDELK